MIQVIDSIIELKKIEKEWKSLCSISNAYTPFQAYEYIKSAWVNLSHSGNLHVIKVIRQKDGLLQMILPTFLDGHGRLRFVNDIHTDFCTPIVHPDFEYDYHMYSEIATYIRESNIIKGFTFDNLQENCYLLSIMEYFFKGSIIRISNKWSAMTIEKRGSSFIDGLMYINAKDRYKLKKMSKDSSKTTMKMYHKDTDSYPKGIINELINDMITKHIRSEAYFHETFLKIFEECYNEKLLSIGITYEENSPISANLYFINGHEFIDWIAMYKDRRYNTWNLLQVIDFIYNAGGGVLNFARGQYDYKIRNFKPVIHSLYRISYNKSLFGQLLNWLEANKYYLKTIVKPYIKR